MKILAFLLYKITFVASRQFLLFRPDTSPRSFLMQNRMIETPGAKIKENFGKSKRPRRPGGVEIERREGRRARKREWKGGKGGE